MSTIVTRSGKGSPLTHAEVDSNFTNLNTDKLELSGGTLTGTLNFGDNVKAQFGASADLQIYHDGSHSVLQEVGTGNLQIATDSQVNIAKTPFEHMATFVADGAVSLYYNNSRKFFTTSTGIDVTGTVVADAATLSGTAPILRYTDTDNTITAEIGSGTSDFNIATTTSHNIDIRTANTRRMVVESDGDISFYEDTGTTAKFFWDASNESLGIGTISPSKELEISATSPELRLSDSNTGTADNFDIGVSNGVATIRVDTDNATSNSIFRITIDAQEHFRILDNGNVGIGNTNPSEKLDVNGTAKATTFEVNGWTITESGGSLYFATGGTNKMKLDASGNLDVVGSVNANATIT